MTETIQSLLITPEKSVRYVHLPIAQSKPSFINIFNVMKQYNCNYYHPNVFNIRKNLRKSLRKYAQNPICQNYAVFFESMNPYTNLPENKLVYPLLQLYGLLTTSFMTYYKCYGACYIILLDDRNCQTDIDLDQFVFDFNVTFDNTLTGANYKLHKVYPYDDIYELKSASRCVIV